MYKDKYFQTISKPEYHNLFPLFDIEFRQFSLILEAMFIEKFEKLEWLSQRYIIDKRIFATPLNITRNEVLPKVRKYIA